MQNDEVVDAENAQPIEEAHEVIKVKADEPVIINLYNTDIEIDESMFEDGTAILRKFGKIYEIVKEGKKKTRKKSTTTTSTTEEEKTVAEVLSQSNEVKSE